MFKRTTTAFCLAALCFFISSPLTAGAQQRVIRRPHRRSWSNSSSGSRWTSRGGHRARWRRRDLVDSRLADSRRRGPDGGSRQRAGVVPGRPPGAERRGQQDPDFRGDSQRPALCESMGTVADRLRPCVRHHHADGLCDGGVARHGRGRLASGARRQSRSRRWVF